MRLFNSGKDTEVSESLIKEDNRKLSKEGKSKKFKEGFKSRFNRQNLPMLICSFVVFLTGLGIFMYPFVSNIINERHASRVIDDFDKKVSEMDKDDIDVIKKAAEEYNKQLQSAVASGEDARISYKDISGRDQVIGYIVIPKIDVNLPIFSGTSQDVLVKGVGHMENSSYPLGGISTHCILTGHRGLPSAVLFTDLDKLAIGDEFYLHILDEVLAYKVDKIKVVAPNDGSDLPIVEGRDLCTLVTCTPYAINSHRLLVRGTRVEYKKQENVDGGVTMQSGSFTKRVVDVWPWLLIAFIITAGTELLIFFMIIKKIRRSRND